MIEKLGILTHQAGFGTGRDHISLGVLMDGATEVIIKAFGTDNSGGIGGVTDEYWLSWDGGKTWPVTGTAPISARNAVRTYSTSTGVVFAGGVGVQPGGVTVGVVDDAVRCYFSGGVLTWTSPYTMNNCLGQDSTFAMHPVTQALYNIGGTGNGYIQKSTDFGANWIDLAPLPDAYTGAAAITAAFYGVDDSGHELYFCGRANGGYTGSLNKYNEGTDTFTEVATGERWDDLWPTLAATVDCLIHVRGTVGSGPDPNKKGCVWMHNPGTDLNQFNYEMPASHARGATASMNRAKVKFAGGVHTIGDTTGGDVWEGKRII